MSEPLTDEQREALLLKAFDEDGTVDTDDALVQGAARLLDHFGWHSDPVLTEVTAIQVARVVLGLAGDPTAG